VEKLARHGNPPEPTPTKGQSGGWPTPTNAGQKALQDCGASTSKIAAAAQVTKRAAGRWLKGTALPTGAKVAALSVAFGISKDAWRLAVAPTLAENIAARPKDNAPPPTIAEATSALLAEGKLSPAERQAAVAVKLREYTSRIDQALEELTLFDKVVCHAGFRAMRQTIVDLLAVDPDLHAAALDALPEPPPDGPVQRLREVRAELTAAKSALETSAAELMAVHAVSRANQLHAQASRCERQLQRARLDGVKLVDLFGSDVWSECVIKLGAALRNDAEALDCVKESLEPIEEPFARRMLEELRNVRHISWPCERFQDDPAGFFYFILGLELWDKQIEMVDGVRDHDFFACSSGRRIGKSAVLAGLALWFYCSFPRARCFIFAPTDHQLQNIVWRELRMRLQDSGVCVACKKANAQLPAHERTKAPCPHSAKIDGVLAQRATGGLHSDDFREITGVTARTLTTAAGLAGEHMLFLCEEASGIAQEIFDAIKGNMAGGARLALFGNPTRNDGEMYDAFYAKGSPYSEARGGKTMRVSSADSPNVKAGEKLIPGLATKEWIRDRAEEWGKESALFKVHVLGEHALGEDGRLIPISLIAEANARWEDADDSGPLHIGLDPAGASGVGDETAAAARRSQRIVEVTTRRGLDDDGHLDLVLDLVRRHGRPGEVATVNVDQEGVGSAVVARLRQYESSNPGVIRVFGFKSSHNARRKPQIYDRLRDEIGAVFAAWLRGGGALPEDVKLAAELHALEMKTKLVGSKGERAKLTPKADLQKLLKRSPDRYDACALSAWEQADETQVDPLRDEKPKALTDLGGGLDPYAGIANDGGTIDPYGLAEAA
jgi:phage terminase large subunit